MVGLKPTGSTPEDFGEFRKYQGPATPASTDPSTFRGAKALAYVRERVGARDIAVDAGPPKSMEAKAAVELHRLIAAGAATLGARPEPEEAGFIVGFDFGTSSSKVVVHQLGAGDPAYALPTPKDLQACDGGESQEHLWRSTVWFSAVDETFSLVPNASAVAIEGFKTGLIQSSGNRMRAVGVTHAQATAAYLAMLIAFILGYHRLQAPAGFNRKAHYGRFHFGVPVACIDEPGCATEFRRVIDAAFALSSSAGELTLQRVRDALADARPKSRAGADTPYVMFEELAAVIAGYRASPDRRLGPHIVVDVGAATLDVATFYIPEGDHKVPVYMSGVDLLGAEALGAARRAQVPDATFQAACVQHTRHVHFNTSLKKNASFFPMNGVPKPLLFVGGGRRTDVHDLAFTTYSNGLEAPLQTPGPGPNLKCDKRTDFARLLLAWGLSQDEAELPLLKPPSQVEAEVRRERDYTASYVDKDMV